MRKVGVFPRRGKTRTLYSAYTMWYDPNWRGCCEHEVLNVNGAAAKKLAIQEHIQKCAATKDEQLLRAQGE